MADKTAYDMTPEAHLDGCFLLITISDTLRQANHNTGWVITLKWGKYHSSSDARHLINTVSMFIFGRLCEKKKRGS